MTVDVVSDLFFGESLAMPTISKNRWIHWSNIQLRQSLVQGHAVSVGFPRWLRLA